jgi:flavin-dependent dehydrogenase
VIDALVVGGGPAGCAAAALLARWGHGVLLVTKPGADTLPLGESIPPSTSKLFDVLGVRAEVERAGFVRSTGNTVWWGSATPRIEYFPQGRRGWQVTTTALEALLRSEVARSGARIEIARAEWSVALERRAAFVLDCSGRAGVISRARRLRVHQDRHQTIAMVGLWRAQPFDVPDPTHTVIESYEGGWVWSVPCASGQYSASDELRFVAVMVDPRRSDLARGEASDEIYRRELAKAEQLNARLGHATLVDGPRGWDSSMYHSTEYVADNVLLVGDAASFVDPLSSVGIKKALASAWLAAVAVHTSLIRPHLRATSLDFYGARERELYEATRNETERYWRDAAAVHAHPFWSDRSSEPAGADQLERVRAAFERIRQATSIRLAVNPDARIEHRPAVSGTEIVLEERLVRPGSPAGIRFAHDVDVLTLTELAPVYTSVPALFDAYNRHRAPVALPQFLSALATVVGHQWLVWCDTN